MSFIEVEQPRWLPLEELSSLYLPKTRERVQNQTSGNTQNAFQGLESASWVSLLVPTTPLPGIEIARLDDSLRQLVEQKSTDAAAFEKIAEDALAVVPNHSDPANRIALHRIASVTA